MNTYQSTTRTKPTAWHLISLLFHPLAMPLWAVALVVLCNATSVRYVAELKPFVIWSVAGMTLVTPLFFWVVLRYFGIVGQGSRSGPLGDNERRQRVLMLVATELCLIGCGAVFAKFMMLFVVRKVLYTAAVVALVLMIMEYLWPLNYHLVAVGALLAVEWVLLYVGNVALLWPFVATIVVAGLLWSAQLHLSKLPPKQICWSLPLGLAVGMATFMLL